MNLLDSVQKIMTPNPITISPEDPLAKVKSVFSKKSIHHIPVLDGGKLVGMVSKSDYLFFKRGFNKSNVIQKMEEIRLHNYRVKDIMTKGLAKLTPDDKINVALEVFKENIFHAIPVLENDKLIGIVTTYDIIRHLAEDKTAVAEYKK